MNALLVMLLSLQATATEDAFKKLEEAIEKAKTVSLKCTSEAVWKGNPGTKTTATLIVFAKEGNRFSHTVTMSSDGQTGQFRTVSDGSKIWTADFGIIPKEPKNSLGKLAINLTRQGLLLSQLLVQDPGSQEKDPKELLLVSKVTSAADEGKAKTLRYEVTYKGALKDISADHTLWYEPSPLKLVKHTALLKEKGEEKGTVTETYETFSINGEIPDETFILPTSK